jgi:Kef-type K+ transport system membrane component KefB
MDNPVFEQLLILMVVVWSAAVMLRRLGIPTILGELILGVMLGPAVLGLVHPNEIIEVLAMMGIFFLMLHAGVETEPRQFLRTVGSSLGVAVVGALVPFFVSTVIALAFGLTIVTALFVGLTMTATAVVVTVKTLRDLGLLETRMARIVIASSIIDDLLALLMFSIILGIVREGSVNPVALIWIGVKSALFFAAVIVTGHYLYPFFRHPFRNRQGKGFTFILILGIGFGLLAEAIGLHIIVGAYLAGLFFREEVASIELIQKVKDRLNGIAYSFLGPIFFISLGFHITFDVLKGPEVWFIIALASACIIGQVASAGGIARLLHFTNEESLMIGIGMCGRSEMAFVLASLGLSIGGIDANVFSALIFTTFLLTLFTPAGLKGCATLLRRKETGLFNAGDGAQM